ncbi:hypothetical protein [Leadbettera azotonutricia]|uniref:Uncharacterized protein n=1 Tax=Leadbettera azotonutricia (strain ATCC BAA-888 / DSM 13862 / ZAS-9) TaxID=545695 RepID=F5YEU0_LEAAZ|nr:hypothetical protein [Leadbettera azotonutricia]AEF82053.1 hypothetical protein TREAZ_0186 [Leadbettera azotonutricia ZAS-9]
MHKKGKIFIIAVFFTLCTALSTYSQTQLADLQKSVEDFSDSMAKSLPFNSTLGLNWSDAYIGKLFPSLPPHFGVGGSFGFTTLDMPSLEKVAGLLGYDIPFGTSSMLFPAYAAEARIGGFFLPFDIGVKFGMLPKVGLWGSSTKMDYLLTGAEFRYAVLDGKSKKLLPNISVGLGFDYLRGGISSEVGSDTTIEFGGHGLVLEKPEVSLLWDTLNLDFKVQISKNILIVTPYLGFGASYAWSKAGYQVDTKASYYDHIDDLSTLQPIDKGAVNGFLNANGLESMDFDGDTISSMIKIKGFSARVFGGLSFDLMVLHLDFTGMYNFLDSNWGASLGFRVQL